jgi:hypothetical protein
MAKPKQAEEMKTDESGQGYLPGQEPSIEDLIATTKEYETAKKARIEMLDQEVALKKKRDGIAKLYPEEFKADPDNDDQFIFDQGGVKIVHKITKKDEYSSSLTEDE